MRQLIVLVGAYLRGDNTRQPKGLKHMPKPTRNDLIKCVHFAWRMRRRGNGVWMADGRSNDIDVGRHSLGTDDRSEALKRLSELDAIVAADHGLAARPVPAIYTRLSLVIGRGLYETYLKRPPEVGGVRKSTQKKYKSAFDKFAKFASEQRIVDWDSVTVHTLEDYASHLRSKDYSGATIVKELVTLQQARRWLVREKHLRGEERLNLKIRKCESQRAYCYTLEQVTAMVDLCRGEPRLSWLRHAIVALACTGLRIAELASLRWADLNLEAGQLSLTDESGRSTSKQGLKQAIKSGKGRTLPIHPDLVQIFAEIPKRDAYVFHGPRGGRLKPDTVRLTLIKKVIKPLAPRFPSNHGEQGFADGRLHSFRHYFASMCAMNPHLTERVAMLWLGHQDSAMVRHYFHLHDAESRRQMARLQPIGNTGNQLTGERAAFAQKGDRRPGRERDSRR
jgi:integrase